MPRVGIALGSNLGDRLRNLSNAIDRLRALAADGEPFLEASIYESEPEFCPPGSPDFLNTVVEIGFRGSAAELLERTREIEKAIGRESLPQRNAPRMIDLDLLYFGGEIVSTPELVLPHPRMAGRRFVIEPLAEIRPDLKLPGLQKTPSQMLADFGGDQPPLRPPAVASTERGSSGTQEA